MKKQRDFKCPKCKSIHDEYVEDEIKTVECKRCKVQAVRIISTPKYFGNTVGRSPAVK